MSIRLYKSYTPGTRNRALSAFDEITKSKPEKSLVSPVHCFLSKYCINNVTWHEQAQSCGTHTES